MAYVKSFASGDKTQKLTSKAVSQRLREPNRTLSIPKVEWIVHGPRNKETD